MTDTEKQLKLSLADAITELLASPKFLQWRPKPIPDDAPERSCLMAEKHFTPDELAELWGVSVDSIRRIFRDEPGVLKMGEKNPRYKRQYLTLTEKHYNPWVKTRQEALDRAVQSATG